MCDTFLALPNSTRNATCVLGKNSDREPDEAQAIVRVPRKRITSDSTRCTFIEVASVRESYECILSKPFQMWGAEMGVNEWGVAIGNEAVFTKVRINKTNDGLTGMDLVRLALERSTSAEEALDCITNLLETYGQDACGGYRNKGFFYHNSFIIADPANAWVLETAGREWAAEKVTQVRSISNGLSIGSGDRLSAGAKQYAQSKKWWKENTPFHFAHAYSDWFYTRMGRAAQRRTCTTDWAVSKRGKLDASESFPMLQRHNLPDYEFKPRKATTGSICMHATGLLNPSQTTGSMVVELRSDKPSTIWLTGTSSPCLSVYKPFFIGTSTLDQLSIPSATPDDSLWWRAERLHRWISKDYSNRRALFAQERETLQQSFLERERSLFISNPSTAELQRLSDESVQQYNEALDKWYRAIR